MADYVIIEDLCPPWRCFEGEQWKCGLKDWIKILSSLIVMSKWLHGSSLLSILWTNQISRIMT